MKVILNQQGYASILLSEINSSAVSVSEGDSSSEVYIDEKFAEMGMDGSTTQAKGSLMSNWLFVLGISAGTLVLSIVFGILLAKKRIKKGFDLYED